MYKLFLLLFLLTQLHASQHQLAILSNITSNSTQEFSISGYRFRCLPYGVIALEELSYNTNLDSICQKDIQKFYLKNPILEQFAQKKLKYMQMYKIEFKESRCILYAQGQKSYSELLLENGLAVLKPIFLDDEFRYSFFKAQENAKLLKKGIWKNEIMHKCIESLYK